MFVKHLQVENTGKLENTETIHVLIHVFNGKTESFPLLPHHHLPPPEFSRHQNLGPKLVQQVTLRTHHLQIQKPQIRTILQYTHTHLHTHTRTHARACTHTHTYVHSLTHTHLTHTQTQHVTCVAMRIIHKFTRVKINMHVYVYACVNVYNADIHTHVHSNRTRLMTHNYGSDAACPLSICVRF